MPWFAAQIEHHAPLRGVTFYMSKSGWFRLWVVSSGALLLSVAFVSAYDVWVADACYSVVTVSVAEGAQQQDRHLAEHIRSEATERSFCGRVQYSALLILEDLAKRGVVTQVGVQWLEPKGGHSRTTTLWI